MRLVDDTPIDPEIAASLAAVDATLAGDPVDPRYAELAELALLLAVERSTPSAQFASALDERVARRFAPAPAAPAGVRKRRRPRRWALWTPAAGLAAAVVVAIVIVAGGNGGNGTSSANTSAGPVTSAPSVHRAAPTSASAAAAARAVVTKSSGSDAQPFSSLTSSGVAVEPIPNGRKIIQGAQLSLTTNPSRIDDVAQEVFVVVGQERGIVSSSSVTATGGPNGYAQFQLSIPSGSMPQTMAALSSLRYARVTSRTDTTQDVNNQYQADVAKVADDQAVRSSLLKQLAAATTQGQIDSLTTRIHDIDAAISSDQATLRSLTNQIDYSQVSLTINGGAIPVPVHPGGGGFGLHQASHDAGRVLTVAAGVALIGLAALVPIALLAALGWWIATTIRRRRREQALDLV